MDDGVEAVEAFAALAHKPTHLEDCARWHEVGGRLAGGEAGAVLGAARRDGVSDGERLGKARAVMQGDLRSEDGSEGSEKGSEGNQMGVRRDQKGIRGE